LLFTFPWLLHFVLLLLGPALASLYYGFTDFTILEPPRFVGLDNYRRLLTEDREFYLAVANTLWLLLILVPTLMLFALTTALLANLPLRGRPVYRTVFFLPSLMPPVVLALLWGWLLNPGYGIINSLLRYVGTQGPLWLASAEWSKPSILVMQLWAVGSTMVLYLAALQDVPTELYEAAEIDGAAWWHKVFYVTRPMISPVTFFLLVINVIWAFQYFTQAYLLGGSGGGFGGPEGSLLFYSLYLYAQAFRYLQMGYASAMGWLMLVLILLMTLLALRTAPRWVHYEGEKR
jgi:multiple sugar transport system permease protein